MSYNTYSIGAQGFSVMSGSLGINIPPQQLRLDARLGVSGVEITRTGNHPRPSQLFTTRDLASWSAGFTLLGTYRGLIGSGALQLIVNGFDFDTINVRLVVLGVDAISHHPAETISGNTLEVSPAAVLECRWSVLPVSYTP